MTRQTFKVHLIPIGYNERKGRRGLENEVKSTEVEEKQLLGQKNLSLRLFPKKLVIYFRLRSLVPI